MEKIDYSMISIKDLPYYYGSATYITSFKNNNIETLGDLLDEEKMNQIIERARRTKPEIKGLVKLVRHQYLDEKLPTEELLDKTMRIGHSNGENSVYSLTYPSGDFYTRLQDARLYEKLVLDMPYSCTNLISRIISNNIDLKRQLEGGKLKVVDFMDAVINTKLFEDTALSQKRCRIMAEIYRINIAAYNDQNKLVITPEIAEILQKRLTEIKYIRESLDIEEKEIKQKLLVYTTNPTAKQLPNEVK